MTVRRIPLLLAVLMSLIPATGRAQSHEIRLYFERNGQLVVVTRFLAGDPATSALEALIAGPATVDQGLGVTTEIPPLTALVALSIEGDTASVTLNGAFLTAGEDAAVTMRYAQVVYTLTQFSGIANVAIDVDTSRGAPQETSPAVTDRLGKSLGRTGLEAALGRMLFESPGLGGGIGASVSVSGIAKILDGVFYAVIRDRDGNTLGSQAVTFPWTGLYEPFSATIALTTLPVTSQYVFLVVIDAIASASQRSSQHIAAIPLWYAA